MLVEPGGRIGLGPPDPLIGGVVLVIEPNRRGIEQPKFLFTVCAGHGSLGYGMEK